LDRLGDGSYTQCSHVIESGVPVCQAEEQIFGCNHVDVAEGAARKWGFPESLVQGLRYVEAPLLQEEFKPERATTALASAIARCAKQGISPELVDVPMWAFPLLQLPIEQAETIVYEGIAEITAAQLSF
jgi:hypothetical protein